MNPAAVAEGPAPGPAEGPALSVAYYAPGWPVDAFSSGIVTYVSTVAAEMRRLGHRARIVAGRIGDDFPDDPEVVALPRDVDARLDAPTRLFDAVAHHLAPTATREMRLARRLRRAVALLASRGPLDLVEIEESLGWASALAGRLPVVVRLHGPWFINGEACGDRPGSPAFERRVRAEGRGLRAASAVSAPSLQVLERTRRHYGLELEGAEVIPNPVPSRPPSLRWRAEEADPDRIVFIGRFDRIKGADLLIDAFARLLRDRPAARLDFIGPDRGLEAGGRSWSLPEYVEHRLPGALADGRVRWLGPRPHAELDEHRRRAAAVVMSSRTENFPLTLAEAMALGCPTVATRVGGVPELVEDGVHGLLCRPEDPEDLAARLAEVLADPADASAMGRRAADRCEAHYSPEAVASRTASLYRRALARAGARGGGRP